MKAISFRAECRACLDFICQPRLARQYAQLSRPTPAPGWLVDWWPAISWRRVLAWAGLLWLINIFALGPIVLTVFEMSGATHRININNLPWFQAIIWAPVLEELLFRFGLRRPFQALWLTPVMVVVLLNGMVWWSSCLFAASAALSLYWCARSTGPRAWALKWLKRYRLIFPYVFHAVALAFAAVHIKNFVYTDLAWWMMAVLVTPQWVTGLVLGWMRVQRGVGTSILLHGLFNAGPLCVAWVALQYAD